jgi:hypothetical protein
VASEIEYFKSRIKINRFKNIKSKCELYKPKDIDKKKGEIIEVFA